MIKKSGSIIFFLLFTLSVFAQDAAGVFLEKYGKDDNLEVISIGKKMFGMMDDASIGDLDIKAVIDGLENIKIIKSKDANLNDDYFDSAMKTLEKSGEYQQLKTNGNFSVLMIKENRNVVKELVFISTDSDNGFSLISLTGNIDMDMLTKISKKY